MATLGIHQPELVGALRLFLDVVDVFLLRSSP
jgi:hypothetical protein